MNKYVSLFENKFVLAVMIVLSVLSIYQFGKCVGQFFYYLFN